jgi:pimeloyl-ACP methyl ester carboxylesterase
MTTGASIVTLANGLTLSYVEQGDLSGPALVLLPGPTDALSSYRSVLEHLPRTIRTVAVSQRGHGESDKPAVGYRVEDFAADVVPLFDALQIERAVLAGHSGSCLVARRVAIDHAERVAGLVLEASPTTLVRNEQLQAFVDSVVSQLRDPIDLNLARSFLVDTSSEAVDGTLLEALAQDLLKVPAHVWRAMFAGLLSYDDNAELDRITAPVLLIWGDADDVVSREMQDQLARRLSRSELVVHPGGGHTPRWEDPARFAADVTAFVDTVG